MGLTADAYRRMQMALLPPGRLWTWVGSLLVGFFAGAAVELERLDGRIANLLDENDPTTAVETLPEYEDELDLVAAATTAERQANVTALLIAQQGFRPADFQTALAPLLGLAAADIQVIERTHAFAVSIGDDREIFHFFIYRDPSLAGTYYLDSAQALVDTIKPSHTVGTVIESINFLCDDPHSLCDRDLLGA